MTELGRKSKKPMVVSRDSRTDNEAMKTYNTPRHVSTHHNLGTSLRIVLGPGFQAGLTGSTLNAAANDYSRCNRF
jgi:hypothetical protein